MADSVTLSSAIRTNLLSLQKTGEFVNRTNNRLSTGLRVASAIDDAVSYFQAKALTDRAGDLGGKKDSIDQAISSVKGAMTGLESIEKVLIQMKGVALSAKSATNEERVDLVAQFNTLANQLNRMAEDTTYQGLNLIANTAASLKVEFSEKTSAVLDIQGVDVRTDKLAGFAVAASNAGALAAGVDWSTVSSQVSSLDTVIKKLDSAISDVRTNAKTLGTNVALLQTRLDFTRNYMNTLKEGGEKLTLADLNEEGANLVSLQTRQQLGIQALSFAGQQEQGVLSLFK